MMNRKGFTLIELLIVVVIIGILAAIAIPKFASTKEKAYLASMKSDLRNLATTQEGFFADNQVYTAINASNIAGVATADAATGFVPSAGVTITAGLSGNGWNATTTHSATSKTCDIFAGDLAVTAGVATVEGEPKCTP
jgi:prepilin-type N-terminal cleavage/methylation domain-containing protein